MYHLKRERFLDGVDRGAKAVAALGGAAAFSQFKSENTLGLWVIGFLTVVSTLSLVYGPSAKARKHAELARDFRRLEASIVEQGDTVTSQQIAKFTGQNLSLASQEPASLGALVTQCHNELCAAEGSKEAITPLPLLDRLFKNWVDIDQTTTKSNYAMISVVSTLALVAGFSYLFRDKLLQFLQILQ